MSNHTKTQRTDLKELRGIGHQLEPIVMVGADGLSDSVIGEINRALDDHELIKIKIPAGDGETRKAYGDELATATNAEVIHRIGRMVLLYKANPEPNVKLSNLHRFSFV